MVNWEFTIAFALRGDSPIVPILVGCIGVAGESVIPGVSSDISTRIFPHIMHTVDDGEDTFGLWFDTQHISTMLEFFRWIQPDVEWLAGDVWGPVDHYTLHVGDIDEVIEWAEVQ